MNTHRGRRPGGILAWIVAVATGLAMRAHAGAMVVETEDFSMELGLRIQPRMELEWITAAGGGTDVQRDFLIRRTRLKAAGAMKGAKYSIEWKIDQTDRIDSTPGASVENAYLQYPLGDAVEFRAGLYDAPFSRDQLTSDSKQLAVDRGAVSLVPGALGLVDNVVGVELLGKVREGRAEYGIGAFDNRAIDGRLQDVPMVAGRLDLNFGSTKDVLRDAHFGRDSWYSLGVNGSYQGSIEDGAGAGDGSNAALGIDGMIDVPTGAGRLFARSEVNEIRTEPPTGGPSVETTVWMIGAGVLIADRFQPFVRFDEVRRYDPAGPGTRDITFVGANLYQNGHGLKIQGDVRFESGTGQSLDGVRLQSQIDF